MVDKLLQLLKLKDMFSISHIQNDPFGKIIDSFVAKSFPHNVIKSSALLIDLLTEEIIGTGKVRLGPKPSPEILVAIRDIIRHYVSKGEPIPFMVPWGSEKPDGSSIDVAEMGALKSLHCLNARAKEHYAPGLQFNVRLEDASAPHLFFENPDKARREARIYTDAFVKLIKVLGLDFVVARPESSLVSELRFNVEADTLLSSFEEYLKGKTGIGNVQSVDSLKSWGWSGEIPSELINYYLSSYTKLYPSKSLEEKVHILARYFSAALARKRLKIRGDLPEWEGKFIDLSFVEAPPGTESYFARRVLYRTLPSNLTSNHMPAWRAKGYLLIDDEKATPKLASFNEKLDFNAHSVNLSNGTDQVEVKIDYIVT